MVNKKVILLSLLLGFWFWQLISVQAQTPEQYNIILLIDNSGSLFPDNDSQGNDPEAKRIRFVQFLARYLQAFEPETRVGVITFANTPNLLIPLASIRHWSEADLAKIKNESQGQETNFTVALTGTGQPDGALQQFQDEQNQPIDCRHEVCKIIIFTDGQPTAGQAELDQALQLLGERGINLTFVLFTKAGRDFWNGKNNVSLLPLDAAQAPTSDIYDTIMRDLGTPLNDEFLKLEPFELEAESILPAAQVPPFSKYHCLTFFADRELKSEHWQLSPTLASTVKRCWLNPAFGPLNVSLEPLTHTLVYYGQADQEQYTLELQPRLIPSHQAVGRPVALEAQFSIAGGAAVTDTTYLGVQVRFEPEIMKPLVLTATTTGQFLGLIPPLKRSGAYIVTFTPVLTGPLAHLRIAPQKQPLTVGETPYLTMQTTLSQTSAITTTFVVTITVENASTIPANFPEPILTINGIPGLLKRIGAHYLSLVEIKTGEAATLLARLSDGKTRQEIEFAAQSVSEEIQVAPVERHVPFLITQISPERPVVSEPVHIEAWFVQAGQIITPTSGLSMQVRVEPGQHVVPLILNQAGHFIGVISQTRPNTYTLVFSPVLSLALLGEYVQPRQQVFYVAEMTPALTTAIETLWLMSRALEVITRQLPMLGWIIIILPLGIFLLVVWKRRKKKKLQEKEKIQKTLKLLGEKFPKEEALRREIGEAFNLLDNGYGHLAEDEKELIQKCGQFVSEAYRIKHANP